MALATMSSTDTLSVVMTTNRKSGRKSKYFQKVLQTMARMLRFQISVKLGKNEIKQTDVRLFIDRLWTSTCLKSMSDRKKTNMERNTEIFQK